MLPGLAHTPLGPVSKPLAGLRLDAVNVDPSFALSRPQQRLIRHVRREGQEADVGNHGDVVLLTVPELEPIVEVVVDDRAGGDPFRPGGEERGEAGGSGLGIRNSTVCVDEK